MRWVVTAVTAPRAATGKERSGAVSDFAIGIDLGTTNTAAAAVVEGVATTLPDSTGRRLQPSVVSFRSRANVVVGQRALERRLSDPTNTVHSVKRLIGRPFTAHEVQRQAARLPFRLTPGDADSILVETRAGSHALPEISALVLRRARAVAEQTLGARVRRAVVTVPASFNDVQREATKLAGALADLEVLRILNEPTAAALAYGQAARDAERVAVFDLGGGTFDVTLLDLRGDVFEVLGTGGDASLGGDDIDTRVAERIADEIWAAHRYDARADAWAWGTLRIVAEFVKQKLSSLDEVTFEIRDPSPASAGRFVHPFRLDRPGLEAIAAPVLARTLEVTRETLARAGLSPRDCGTVLFVGGGTRMPLVGRMVHDLFGRAPARDVSPEEAVALGAAIQAEALAGRANRITRVHASTDPVAPPPSVPAPISSRRLPAARDRASSTADPRRTTAPGIGELLAGGLPTRPRPALLVDVTPLSLRVETAGGYSDTLIDANSPVPCDRTRTFRTAHDGQTAVTIRVAQGESALFGDNVYLGELALEGIPAAQRGEARIEVTFELDASGILSVRAREARSGRDTRASLALAGMTRDAALAERLRARQGSYVLEGGG